MLQGPSEPSQSSCRPKVTDWPSSVSAQSHLGNINLNNNLSDRLLAILSAPGLMQDRYYSTNFYLGWVESTQPPEESYPRQESIILAPTESTGPASATTWLGRKERKREKGRGGKKKKLEGYCFHYSCFLVSFQTLKVPANVTHLIILKREIGFSSTSHYWQVCFWKSLLPL